MRAVRLFFVVTAFFAPLAALGPSCALVGFENVNATDAGDADATTDVDTGPACGHATVPPQPDGGTNGGTIEFTVAVRTIDLGDVAFGEKATPPALDIDGLCTCLGEKPGCVHASTATESDYCDYDLGRDNAAAQTFYSLSNGLGMAQFSSALFSQRANDGKWSLLMRVSNYNGEPDDAQVTFSMYVAGDLQTIKGTAPAWNGSDAWPVSSQSVKGSDVNAPVVIDNNAYVTGHVLVASAPSMQIDLLRPTDAIFRIKLIAGIIKANIVLGDGGAPRLTQGLLAARWKADDLFRSGWLICKNEVGYNAVKSRACEMVDTGSKLAGPNEFCDALSFGMAFTAEPAMLGSLYDPLPIVTSCTPENDPASDSCALDAGAL